MWYEAISQPAERTMAEYTTQLMIGSERLAQVLHVVQRR